MSEAQSAQSVAWDLTDLYAAPDDPRLTADLETALAAAQSFASTYRGTIHTLDGPAPEDVADAVALLEQILERTSKVAAYAELLHAADSTPPAHGALVAATQERASAVRQATLFFELEWLALDDAAAERVMAHPRCARYRHFLRSIRRYRPQCCRSPRKDSSRRSRIRAGARSPACSMRPSRRSPSM